MLSINPVIPDIQGNCWREHKAKETHARWRQGCQVINPALVNLWTQVRNQCPLAKAVSKYLLCYDPKDA
jgi:hypothetical protein